MKIKFCRNCKNSKFLNLLSLGKMSFTGKFSKTFFHNIPSAHLNLLMCRKCKFVQLFRVFLTTLRHLTISLLLSMPYDSSGAFKCVNCKKVVLSDLILAKNDSYSYFWESIFILHKKKLNKC